MSNIETTTQTLDTSSSQLMGFAWTNDVDQYPKRALFYTKKGVDDSKIDKSGDTMIGQLNVPNETFTGQSDTISPINITKGQSKTTPADGDVENDGQTLLYSDSGATRIGHSGIIYSASAAQTIANTITETSLFSSTAYYTTPTIRNISANSLKQGKNIRIKLSGTTNTAASSSNLTLKVKLGTTVLITVVEDLTNNITGDWFEKEINIVCRTTGSSGTVTTSGKDQYVAAAGGSPIIYPIVTSSSTINTTIAQQIDVTATWQSASSSNSITVNTATIEILA